MYYPTLNELPPPPAGQTGWPWTEETPPLQPDGSSWPRISIVTPTYNQAPYLEETIRSVLLQGYPNLECIIINDGSTDNTVDIIRKYEPWLAHWATQPNQGQCAAINHGFQFVTGQIQGYLNSDDILLPGALQRVAQEIDPAHGRHVVMGRCRFTDEKGRFTGIEHPSHFESHRRVLEVWKGHTIPQPAVFWTPEVWQTCGPIIEDLGPAWIDYGLFCRFSKKYIFYYIDQVMATYRLHLESKTQRSTEISRLAESIQISQRYWGSPWSLMYWQLTVSLARHRFNRAGRGLNWLQYAKEAYRHGHKLQAVGSGLVGAVIVPEVAFYAAIYPFLRDRVRGAFRPILERLTNERDISPRTKVYLDHTDPWPDNWTGPRLVLTHQAEPEVRSVQLKGKVDFTYLGQPLTLTVQVDGQTIGQHQLEQSGNFSIELPLTEPLLTGMHIIEVQANTYFVPHRFVRNNDYRPLSWQVGTVQFSC